MIRSQKRLRLCTALLIANLALVWGNSLLPGSDSGSLSGSVMEFVMTLLGIPEAYADTVHLLIRKAAHFTEFACLSGLLTWLCGMLGQQGFHLASLPVFGGMTAALVDETIQLFTPDRGPSLTDVWIDTAGALTGMMILLCGYHLIRRIKHN